MVRLQYGKKEKVQVISVTGTLTAEQQNWIPKTQDAYELIKILSFLCKSFLFATSPLFHNHQGVENTELNLLIFLVHKHDLFLYTHTYMSVLMLGFAYSHAVKQSCK